MGCDGVSELAPRSRSQSRFLARVRQSCCTFSVTHLLRGLGVVVGWAVRCAALREEVGSRVPRKASTPGLLPWSKRRNVEQMEFALSNERPGLLVCGWYEIEGLKPVNAVDFSVVH